MVFEIQSTIIMMIELERSVTSKYFFTRLDARYLVQVVHVSIEVLELELELGWSGVWV